MATRRHIYAPIKKSVLPRVQPARTDNRDELRHQGVTWKYFGDAWTERLVEKGPNECWGWIGAYHRQGYALFCVQKEGDDSKSGMMNAQRFAMALKIGRPLSHAERVGSNCRTLDCCNPNHLYITNYAHQCDHVKDIPFNGRPRKYTEEFFMKYYSELSSLGPMALAEAIPELTRRTAASAKFAFKTWLQRMST